MTSARRRSAVRFSQPPCANSVTGYETPKLRGFRSLSPNWPILGIRLDLRPVKNPVPLFMPQGLNRVDGAGAPRGHQSRARSHRRQSD